MQELIEKYSKNGKYLKTSTNMWQYQFKEQEKYFKSWIFMERRHEKIQKLLYRSENIFKAYPLFIPREEF